MSRLDDAFREARRRELADVAQRPPSGAELARALVPRAGPGSAAPRAAPRSADAPAGGPGRLALAPAWLAVAACLAVGVGTALQGPAGPPLASGIAALWPEDAQSRIVRIADLVGAAMEGGRLGAPGE
jgi:hypothetical protein